MELLCYSVYVLCLYVSVTGAHRDNGRDEIQNPEISSCVPEPPQVPTSAVDVEQIIYTEYVEYPDYPEYTSVMPLIEPQRMYFSDPDGNYSPCLYYHSPPPVYYQ